MHAPIRNADLRTTLIVEIVRRAERPRSTLRLFWFVRAGRLQSRWVEIVEQFIR